MPDTPGESQNILRLSALPARGPVAFRLEPDAAARARLAEALGLRGLRKLRFEGRITPEGRRDWVLQADLGATVVQDCGVTLAPVTTRIDEPVLRRYLAAFPEPEAGGEIEMPEDDSAEPLPEALDLAAVMAEALALALPPFPRAPGAALGQAVFTEPGRAPMTDAEARPFSALKVLKDRLDGSG